MTARHLQPVSDLPADPPHEPVPEPATHPAGPAAAAAASPDADIRPGDDVGPSSAAVEPATVRQPRTSLGTQDHTRPADDLAPSAPAPDPDATAADPATNRLPRTSPIDTQADDIAGDVQPQAATSIVPGPDMVQLLDPDGRPVTHPTYTASLSDDDARTAYTQMLLARRLDDEGTHLQRQGQLALWPPMKGQEAAQVGAVQALRNTDMVYPSYRELAMALARGLDPVSIFQTFRGVAHMSWDVSAHHFALYAFVVGAQTLQATGHAMGIGLDGADEVVLCCLGDGATSEGHVNEALNYAAVFNAPVVFLVQNNQWAISVPTSKQFKAPLTQRAEGFGIPAVRVDGNDLLAVHAVIRRAADEARTQGGPRFVEAVTYRLGAHTTADDPTRYRTREEESEWSGRDPLARVERYLREHLGAGDDFFTEAGAQADALAADVRQRVLALPSPEITDLYDHVLAAPSAGMREEREQVRAYLSSLEGR